MPLNMLTFAGDAIRSANYKQILVILIPLMLTADKSALLGLVGIK